MRFVGRLIDWNDAKGYGFVEPHGGGERAFVHIRAFGRGSKRPENGALISYAIERDAQQRVAAIDVRFAKAKARREPDAALSMPRKGIAIGFASLLVLGWFLSKIPDAVLILFGAMSLVSFLMYRADKTAAREGGWRTPESTLHLVDLLGGWPGGLIAQDVFRHKSKKAAFQAVFWVTVVANCVLVAWWLNRGIA